MADKLDWLGKHFVLLRHISVADAVAVEGYKIPPDLADLFEGVNGAAEMAFKLAGLGKYKNACELMLYIAHRRAAAWWAYRCVCSLNDELRQKPPQDIDFENIPKPPPHPPYFNFDVPKPDPALVATMEAALSSAKGAAAESAALVNPAMKKYIADGVAVAFKAFESANGVHPMALLKQLGQRMKQDPYAIDPASPIFRMKSELTEKLTAQRTQIISDLKSAHVAAGLNSPIANNLKLSAHHEKLKGAALNAIYRWIVAPDVPNTQKCLDIGNECSDSPEGLLSLCCFWAFGNLLPDGDQVVATPPGLAANGIDKVLMLCAIQQGGTRKLAERFELYFNMGVDVLSGKDNWGESLTDKTPPHEQKPSPPPPPPPPPDVKPAPVHEKHAYKRWKPKF
jgi:hypothetical protein